MRQAAWKFPHQGCVRFCATQRALPHLYSVYYEQQAVQYTKEVAMELVLLIGIAVAVLLLLRPAPQPTIIYVPVEVAEARGGLGCLPLLLIGALALLALGAVRW